MGPKKDTHWNSEVMPAHAVSLDKVHLKGTVFYFTNNLFPIRTKEWKGILHNDYLLQKSNKTRDIWSSCFGVFFCQKEDVFKLILNKILHLCSGKAEYLNNCILPQPAGVLRELSSRHLELFCFNQKEEYLTLRKHIWFAWAFEIYLLKKKIRDIGWKTGWYCWFEWSWSLKLN